MKISIKALRKVYSDCCFKLGPGPMRPIIDADNYDYYLHRAIELINTSKFSDNANEHLKMAIQVLALAIIKNNDKSH